MSRKTGSQRRNAVAQKRARDAGPDSSRLCAGMRRVTPSAGDPPDDSAGSWELQRIIGRRRRPRPPGRQAQDGAHLFQDLDGLRLHFLDRAGDDIRPRRSPRWRGPRRRSSSSGSVAIARSGSNSTMIACSRIRAARFSAPSEANGSSLVSTCADRSSRSRRTVAARFGEQDQHADHRLLEAAAIDAEQDCLDLRQISAIPWGLSARALEGVAGADPVHRRRAVDGEKAHFIGGVAQVAHQVEALDDARRPNLLQRQERIGSARPACARAQRVAPPRRPAPSADSRPQNISR